MEPLKKLDLINTPLEGTNLIEASAGTGKTYTITWLFLRLILEKGLTVNQILVVTFTEAATEELKDRIRGRIREAEEACATDKFKEPLLGELISKCKNKSGAQELLRQALRDFDQAAIFTIHGFCKRMLHENAFESNSLFDTELETNSTQLKQDLVEDFWRKHIYFVSPLFVNYALSVKFTPEALAPLTGPNVFLPDIEIIPRVVEKDLSRAEQKFYNVFDEVAQTWLLVRAEIEEILVTTESLSLAKYKKEKIPGWLEDMDSFVKYGRDNSLLFDSFQKFTATEVEASTKKNQSVPKHSFFNLCDKLLSTQQELTHVYEQQILALKIKLFQYIRDNLPEQKRRLNILHFEDLLLNLQQSLSAEGGDQLTRAIQDKFHAALIDEFQDTDSVQYDIFKRIFSAGKSVLFMIGDPKQAIYGFRGADIFAYMDAARHVQTRYTLDKNWRSEPNLVQAVNTLFGKADRPFVYEDIGFEPVDAADQKDSDMFLLHRRSDPPLQLWYLKTDQVPGTKNTISKTAARKEITLAVAAEISRLLNLGNDEEARIGEKSISAGDIAVLVRRNTEAQAMKRALTTYGIPSVLYSAENLFNSFEALEMQRFLSAVAAPNREPLFLAALATDLIGFTGEQIESLYQQENKWETWLLKFRDFHDLWKKRGFITMFRQFLSELSVQERLMNYPDGECRNTNVLHLAEVLHQRTVEKNLGMFDLIKWLAEQRNPDSQRLEEHQLRLESDEKAVKLVTIHKSKGLQYPIVFCPFLWDGSTIKSSTGFFTFHDESLQNRLTLDLGSDQFDSNRLLAEKEQLAENLRLLYVALTRAINRCYLVWGRFKTAETSAPAYLFHQPKDAGEDTLISATSRRFQSMNDNSVKAELNALCEGAQNSIAVTDVPVGVAKKYRPGKEERLQLDSRKFDGKIDHTWKISSFSSLVSRMVYSAELADYDATSVGEERKIELAGEVIVEQEPAGIFQFTRGARSGTFLHKVFEELDFLDVSSSDNEKIIRSKMDEYHVDSAWFDVLFCMIKKVLTVPLYAGEKSFVLSHIQNENRLNELEFYFPLKMLTPIRLKKVFDDVGLKNIFPNLTEQIGQLMFSPVLGFMKGFIDLVFLHEGRYFIIDWKSNYLGARVEDYDQNELLAAMGHSNYVLQYHLYVLALHQYLKYRVPGYDYEKMFGGVFYIFLRGVDPLKGTQFGVFSDRPSRELVEKMSRELINVER